MFSGSMKPRPGCLFMGRAIHKQGKAASDTRNFSDAQQVLLRPEQRKQRQGGLFFSEHGELTEDKQVSRSVGSSRKTDYCTGISQRFELCDVGYLPGASMGCAVGTRVQGVV